MVDAPVAAIELLTSSGQLRARVGDYLLVVDLGAGCEATMLRRTPAGSETISALDDPDTGGRTLDDLLLDPAARDAGRARRHRGRPCGRDGTCDRCGGQGGAGECAGGGRGAVVSAGGDGPMPATAPTDGVDRGGSRGHRRPVWTRAGELALEAIAAADLEPTQVSAVVCIGGGANSPAAVQVIADAVGQKPLVPDDPGRAALWGAAGATPATDDQVDASDGSWAAARAVARHVPALVVAGVASLAMFAQFVLQADPQNGTPFNHDQHYWVQCDLGRAHHRRRLRDDRLPVHRPGRGRVPRRRETRPARRATRGRRPGRRHRRRVRDRRRLRRPRQLPAGLPPGAFLRWSVLPLLPIPAVLAVTALVVRRRTAPIGGWMRWLRFSALSIVFVAVGMALLQY